MALTGPNTLAARDGIKDLQAAAENIVRYPNQLDIENRQELDALLKDKADGAAEDQQALAQSPKARRLLKPKGNSGKTYTVDWSNKGPKVVGYDYEKSHCCRNALIGTGVGAVVLGGAGLAYLLLSSDEESDDPGTALATLEANMTTAASNLTTVAATVITPLALPIVTLAKSLFTSTEAPFTLPQEIDSSITTDLTDWLNNEAKITDLPTTTEEVTSASTTTTAPKPKRKRKPKTSHKVKTTTTTTPAPTTTSASTTEQTTMPEQTARTRTTKAVEDSQNPSGRVPQCLQPFHAQWMQSVQQNRDVFLDQCQKVFNPKQLVQCKWQYRQKVQPYMQGYNKHLKRCIQEYSMRLMQEISSSNSGRLPEKDLQTIQQSNQQQVNEARRQIEQKLSSHVQQWHRSINNRYANSYNAQQFVEDMRQYSQTLLGEITGDFTQLTQNMWQHNEGQLIAYRTAYQQQQAAQRRRQHDVNNVSEAERARHNAQVLKQYRRQHKGQQLQHFIQRANQNYEHQAQVSADVHNAVAPDYEYIDNNFYCYYPGGYTYVYYPDGYVYAYYPDRSAYVSVPGSNTFAWLGRH